MMTADSQERPIIEAHDLRIYDYPIDQAGYNWSEVLSEWHWLLPRDFTLWLVNRFGDLFIILDDGTVHMLDVGGATLEQVADNRDQFLAIVDDGDNANNWLMIPLVDKCAEAGLNISAGQIYGYKTPPILGGDYIVENTEVCDLKSYFSVLGKLQYKIKDLPDGTEVDGLKISN